MFDPNKYDNSNSQNNSGKSKLQEFIEKKEGVIRYLMDMKPLILKECTSLEKQVEEDPESDKAKAFKRKLDGWSRILNGLAIVEDMYRVKK